MEDVRWLDQDERGAWLAIAALMLKLPNALDSQLQADHGLSFFDYMVLAMLSETDDNSLQMSDLAALTSSSLSRLSHVVKRLEGELLLRRESLPGRGRRTRAVLTPAGLELVVAAAPGHVRRVRELVIDDVDPADLAAVQRVGLSVLARLGERLPPGAMAP